MSRVTLRVIRTDALLWALGGFDDEPHVHSRGRYEQYTPADLRLIRSFYRRFSTACGRLERGRATELANWLGRDPVALRMSMRQMRRRGVLPPLRGTA